MSFVSKKSSQFTVIKFLSDQQSRMIYNFYIFQTVYIYFLSVKVITNFILFLNACNIVLYGMLSNKVICLIFQIRTLLAET